MKTKVISKKIKGFEDLSFFTVFFNFIKNFREHSKNTELVFSFLMNKNIKLTSIQNLMRSFIFMHECHFHIFERMPRFQF